MTAKLVDLYVTQCLVACIWMLKQIQQQCVILSKGNVIFLPHVVFSSYSHQVDPSFTYKMSQKIDFNYNEVTLPNLKNRLQILKSDVLSHVKNKVALFLFSLKIRQIWAISYIFRLSIASFLYICYISWVYVHCIILPLLFVTGIRFAYLN